MADVNELRDRAARWRQVGRGITDERAIEALNDTAADLEERADQLERERQDAARASGPWLDLRARWFGTTVVIPHLVIGAHRK
jgi:hypothetical protein